MAELESLLPKICVPSNHKPRNSHIALTTDVLAKPYGQKPCDCNPVAGFFVEPITFHGRGD
jgi:hypothetical protein